MLSLTQFRNPDLSLWQSAMNETLVKRMQAAATGRPTLGHPLLEEATRFCMDLDDHLRAAVTGQPAAPAAALPDVAGYCSSTALKLAQAILSGDQAQQAILRQQLGKFTQCDPGYLECVQRYVDFYQVCKKDVPYIRYQNLGDFVIDGRLPAQARVAIVGDWGTGQDAARTVLQQIARKKPDVVIHLGDIYYSGTQYEVQNYFYDLWKSELDLARTPTFTLSGNHDMFSGGVPYYELLQQLEQPASYFCLRNADWQFVAMDTGLHDHDPLQSSVTYLEDSEAAWVTDKVRNAGGRKTILLSHHQLFTAKEDIGGQAVNPRLQQQLQPILSQVAMWIWGHEHDLVLYGRYLDVLGRCAGHGAFPVEINAIPATPRFPQVPMLDVELGHGDALYNHGYLIMDLNGPAAEVAYYQDSDETTPLYREAIPAAAASGA